MPQKPLEGIRVLDLTRILSGPYCTMILNDLGAEIIKVEMPFTGDDSRSYGPFIDKKEEKSAYFTSINTEKKSLSLNLKQVEGQEVLSQLIQKSDVMVENYKPGTLSRLGFSEGKIKKLNPKIIFASVSGFGQQGPESGKAAYDGIIQAMSGLMSITGTDNGQCVRVGVSISDIIAGLYTAIGIMAALFRRDTQQIGTRLDIAMLDTSIAVLENAIARAQLENQSPSPIGTRHPSITPFESYRTKDSSIYIAAGNDKLFKSLADVLEHPELAEDIRFKTNQLRTKNHLDLRLIINKALSSDTTTNWLEKLNNHNIPCAPVNNVKDLFEWDQVSERKMLIPLEGEADFKVAGNPIKFSGEADTISRGAAPKLGEHNEKILKDILGYSNDKISHLYRIGALF